MMDIPRFKRELPLGDASAKFAEASEGSHSKCAPWPTVLFVVGRTPPPRARDGGSVSESRSPIFMLLRVDDGPGPAQHGVPYTVLSTSRAHLLLSAASPQKCQFLPALPYR